MENIKNRLSYDTQTGLFHWSLETKNQNAGKIAGQITKDGYVRIHINGKKYLAHRLAWWYVYGHFPERIVDHIDRNKQNNAISNLRIADPKENAQNRGNAVGFTWHEKTQAFSARIIVNGKLIGLGYHKTALDARAAYLKAKKQYHPSFER
jgi:hypothetical protein